MGKVYWSSIGQVYACDASAACTTHASARLLMDAQVLDAIVIMCAGRTGVR